MGTKKTAVSTAAAGLTALLLATGCSGGSDDDGGGAGDEKAQPRPVISEGQARKVLERYVETNNAANAALDRKALGEVEGGALYQQSQAQYRQFPTYEKKYQALYKKPFRYRADEAQYYIPARGDWYMVDAPVEGPGYDEGDRSLLVFERAGGGTWKNVASVGIQGRIPEVARGDGGLPTVLPAGTEVGTTALDGLDDAVNDLYVSGGKKDGKLLADSEVRKNMVKDHATRRDWIRPEHDGYFETEFESENHKWDDAYKPAFPDVYALRTADGGALTVFNSYDARVDFATRPGFHVIPGDATSLYVKEKEPLGVREYYAVQNAAHVPEEGKVEQLGGEVEMIGAS
ncbi:hypothetical protein AA958_31975 [Streptomyces sp. CNQ-509]|uniref:hypothetical protein n=1 Tax=unclassified Streptomyces TaxID=2593676 RepID=UPI00062DEDA8|nr:hypothetical protein [Streptomyces sp. CNQ-509]AKH86072.1 hypothetical protein AA958_31975 [Streptomyces sp. CNQ-509]